MILTAGFNVYPAEIERVLCTHPAVALAAVGSLRDGVKGELAKAYVILKPGSGGRCVQGATRSSVCCVGTDHIVGQDHAENAERSRRRLVRGQ
jgi:acyl-CoA synthetase (AMP-forming)/AMP-acid ligase II